MDKDKVWTRTMTSTRTRMELWTCTGTRIESEIEPKATTGRGHCNACLVLGSTNGKKF